MLPETRFLERFSKTILPMLMLFMGLFLTTLAQAKMLPRLKNILIIGDSLSAAYGIDPNLGWVTLLQQKIQTQYPNQYKLINVSNSGDTTANGLNQLESALRQYHPCLVVIALGSNDGLRGFPFQSIKSNLLKMIKMALDSNPIDKHPKVILFKFRLPPNYGHYAQGFEAIYDQLSRELGIPISEFLPKNIAVDHRFFLEDRLHPNEKAQNIILNTVWHSITKNLNS